MRARARARAATDGSRAPAGTCCTCCCPHARSSSIPALPAKRTSKRMRFRRPGRGRAPECARRRAQWNPRMESDEKRKDWNPYGRVGRIREKGADSRRGEVRARRRVRAQSRRRRPLARREGVAGGVGGGEGREGWGGGRGRWPHRAHSHCPSVAEDGACGAPRPRWGAALRGAASRARECARAFRGGRRCALCAGGGVRPWRFAVCGARRGRNGGRRAVPRAG